MVLREYKMECIMLLTFKESFELEMEIFLSFKVKIRSKEQLINTFGFW